MSHRAILTPSDILRVAARPQQHSTYVPKKRDWRYASGVFRHEDFNDVDTGKRAARSIWDKLDEEYKVEDKKEKKKKVTKGNRKGKKTGGGGKEGEKGLRPFTITRLAAVQYERFPPAAAEKAIFPSQSEETESQQTALIAILKFPASKKDDAQAILKSAPAPLSHISN